MLYLPGRVTGPCILSSLFKCVPSKACCTHLEPNLVLTELTHCGVLHLGATRESALTAVGGQAPKHTLKEAP